MFLHGCFGWFGEAISISKGMDDILIFLWILCYLGDECFLVVLLVTLEWIIIIWFIWFLLLIVNEVIVDRSCD